ncbi:MAG: hypothetical protein K8T20_02170 [Planctomycetes bacterium]|nr:hypothetical protein [Planctomycetota bacterium]
MNFTRAALLLLLLASIAAVIAAGMRGTRQDDVASPPAGGKEARSRGGPGSPADSGGSNGLPGGKEPLPGTTTVDVPPVHPPGIPGSEPDSRESAAEKTRQRMQRIARAWLDDLEAGFALSDAQQKDIWERVLKFIKDYEALRWRRGIEEDVERTITRLYEKAEADIVALLGEGQAGDFPGLPRDWEEGLLDPGPGH